MAGYQNLLATITPARFKVGQMIGATGLLLGIALAMYRRVDPDKRRNYRSMFISTVLAVFLTGVTEPLEFMFMFCALPLYLVYAVLQGMRLCHGRPHPPQASFLWQPGIPDPRSHVHPRRTWRRPGKLHPLCGCILCRRIRNRLFYDREGSILPPRADWATIPTTLSQRTARGRAGSPSSGDSQAGRIISFWAAGITLSWWTPA